MYHKGSKVLNGDIFVAGAIKEGSLDNMDLTPGLREKGEKIRQKGEEERTF